MSFVHLHVHTEYSLLDGSNKIKEYVKRLGELGMKAGAITDHGVMYGVIDFYRAAKDAGIKPILGCEVYVAPNSRFDKEVSGGEERYHHLILLAENNQGYANLMKIVSRGFTEGYYYRPRVDMEVLEKYHEGIIALSACLAGEVQRYLLKGLYDEACKVAKRYEACFGQGNFFLELQDHGISEQQMVNMELLKLSRDTGITLVATNDVHYTYAEDAQPHDVLLCVQTGKKITDEDRMRYEGGQFYVKSQQQMEALFPYAQEAIHRTGEIADRCEVTLEFGAYKLPHFALPEGVTGPDYLRSLCLEGLKKRYPSNYEAMMERMDYELQTISNMGFVDYFLIVWDFIRYSKQQDIIVGPGRGSAAGSIVAYSLGITGIDPIKYQLLFERFLNPERVTMPDIDIDFCYERRQEVIEYVVHKYGSDKVVQIVTFGTMAAKGVIRDVARAMDLPYSVADEIAKMIPNELNITIRKALEMNAELRERYKSDDTIKNLIDMSQKLEGLPRHTSMHAAGVVICPDAADEFVPLSRGSDGSVTTQFTMTLLEELGLLKMDFLGLRTLTVIQNALRLIHSRLAAENPSLSKEQLLAKYPYLDLDTMDYDDKEVFAYIGTAKTDGIFQLESAGMKNFMKELKPRNLEDVIAGISLYRPGPMDFIPQYIRGKEQPDRVTYLCPELEPILAPTYGCIVYQEQVMQIVRDLGGYTLGQSDLLRRAMSKKKASVMEKERKNFVEGNSESGIPGCVAKGISREVASAIYDMMTDFAKYAFNKSHAAAYAVVSYQTAYLKYYYPVEYMAALMTSVIDNPGKVSEYILSCKSMGISILSPDINESEAGFSVYHQSIRFALTAIKSVGRPVIENIVRERSLGGLFTSLEDFLTRMTGMELNKRAVEHFIKAGTFDGFGATRKQHMQVYSQIMDKLSSGRKSNMAGQISLFDLAADESKDSFYIPLPDVGEYDLEDMLAYEKEVLGCYVSGHPLDEYRKLWQRMITNTTLDFVQDEETGQATAQDGQRGVVGGIIVDRKIKYTRNNKVMAFLTLEDLLGTMEIIVFPNVYEKNANQLTEDHKVFITGRISIEEDKPGKIIAEEVKDFADIPRTLWIKFPTKEAYFAISEKLERILSGSDGKDIVRIYLEDTKQYKEMQRNKTVRASEELKVELERSFGAGNVTIT